MAKNRATKKKGVLVKKRKKMELQRKCLYLIVTDLVGRLRRTFLKNDLGNKKRKCLYLIVQHARNSVFSEKLSNY